MTAAADTLISALVISSSFPDPLMAAVLSPLIQCRTSWANEFRQVAVICTAYLVAPSAPE
jgi:hypothetical protein